MEGHGLYIPPLYRASFYVCTALVAHPFTLIQRLGALAEQILLLVALLGQLAIPLSN